MADRVSRLVLTFDGEEGTIDSVLASIKGSVRNAVADIERTTKRVVLFETLETKVKGSADALAEASAKAKLLAAELEKVTTAGGKATPELVKGLQAANREVTIATTAYNRNVDALTKLQVQLSKVGVDTSNLARAQLKLADSSKAAAAAAEQQAAKQALGVKTLSDIQPQIAKLNAAYETLRVSGKLSTTELAAAQVALHARIKETTGEVSKLGSGFRSFVGGEISTGLAGFGARFLGITAVVAGLASAVGAGITANREYQQSLAEIGTVTNLSKEQLDALGAGARRLAVDIGFDLQEGLKALFELIRSGVPPENALQVLAVSAEAAKASLTDVGTAAKVSTLLIDGFGLEVEDLRSAFDALLQGSKDGGATLKEFAASAGPLLNVARSLRVPFNDLVAVLTVMTDASNDAQGSIQALTKIIVRLGDADVRSKLRALGIESTNLVDVFKQLGEKGIPLQAIIDLGIASTKTAAGVAALTNNTSKLAPELDKVAKSAGNLASINAKLYDSPKERSERFNAALHETAVQFGELVGSGSQLQVQATNILAAFNSLIGRFSGVKPAAEGAAASIGGVADATKRAGDEAKAATISLEQAKTTLTDFSAKLLTAIQALQSASTGNIAEIQARAAAEIAALDKTVAATADTAARTIAIQQKAGADRLAEILATEAKVSAAVETAVAARTKLLESSLKGDKDRETKIAGEVAKIRLDAAQKTLADLRSLLNDEQTLRQQHVANINTLEQGRVAFNRSVEEQLFQLRLGSLSVFDQYVAKVNEVERLTALARKQGAEGFIADATATSLKAIELAKGIGKVVNEQGVTIVGKYEAQGLALKTINEVQKNLNENIEAQKGLEQGAAAALGDRVNDVSLKIADLQAQVNEFKNDLANNLKLEIRVDTDSVTAANAVIDEVARKRFVDVVIRTTKADGTPAPVDIIDLIPRGLAGGGYVGGYAGGGAVFRPPSWNKVPGQGSGDTVPAALPVGSFVLRKAASTLYGDNVLAKMARGYATGGFVNPVLPTVYQKFFAANQSPSSDYLGSIPSGGPQAVREVGQIAPPRLPDDKNALIRKVLEYANAVVVAAGPERYIFDRAIKQLNAELHMFDRDQDIDTLMSALQTARAIGLNLGISTGRLFGFDVDGRKWHKEQVYGMFGALGFSPGAASYHFYARGGGVDSVPAMLTPGEYVFNPNAVAKYGGGFMQALNRMEIPKAYLENIMNFAPPRPQHFATGGYVTAASGGGSAPSTTVRRHAAGAGILPGGGNLTVIIQAQTVDEATVRRDVIPIIRKAMKRSD